MALDPLSSLRSWIDAKNMPRRTLEPAKKLDTMQPSWIKFEEPTMLRASMLTVELILWCEHHVQREISDLRNQYCRLSHKSGQESESIIDRFARTKRL